MIKLTDEQAAQLDQNLEAALEDLNTAAFESSDQTPLVCTGALIGMAMQKLHDIRQFIANQTMKELNESMTAKEAHVKQTQQKVPDIWEEPKQLTFKRIPKPGFEVEEIEEFFENKRGNY
jgi:hypothetical protein